MVSKEEKEILRQLVKKELKCVKEDEKDTISLASLKFIKSIDKYEEKLKELLKNL